MTDYCAENNGIVVNLATISSIQIPEFPSRSSPLHNDEHIDDYKNESNNDNNTIRIQIIVIRIVTIFMPHPASDLVSLDSLKIYYY